VHLWRAAIAALLTFGSSGGVINAQAPDFYDHEDLEVLIINKTSLVMWSFHASRVALPDWGPDLLGDHVVFPGQAILVNIDDGSDYCVYDLHAVFHEGSEAVRWHRDMCELPTWEIEIVSLSHPSR
jgi:hypothetical protein